MAFTVSQMMSLLILLAIILVENVQQTHCHQQRSSSSSTLDNFRSSNNNNNNNNNNSNNNNNNSARQQGDLTSSGSGGANRASRRRQPQQQLQNKPRNGTPNTTPTGKSTWVFRRKNPSSNNNNNSNNNSSNNPNSDPLLVPIINVDRLSENPPFPPRSDSFWKNHHSEHPRHPSPHSRAGNNGKRHGKKRQHEETQIGPKMTKVGPEPASSSTKSTSSTSGETNNRGKHDRPNIILIITDDQDVELGSMNYMPETIKEFQERGLEFRHGYVTTPMCCPSRSSMLTGLYVHNHQVFTNNDNCSSIQWREKYEKKTFAYQLQQSGYYTAYIGKYLNKYDGSHIPEGWDEWNGLLMNSRFYNYTINRNGKKYRFGNTYEFDYYPDLITNDTVDFLERVSGFTDDSIKKSTPRPLPQSDPPQTSDDQLPEFSDELIDEAASGEEHKQPSKTDQVDQRKFEPRRPFLLVISYPSPHGPEDSAPQYSQLFLNSTPHHTPSYDYAPNLDKQWILRVTDRMSPQLRTFTDLLMTKRLQTLQSVDDAVRRIFDKLRQTRLLDSSYIFYTSDHGYHVGQFGLIKGKSMPYEFDIRVPFYLRVPKGPNRPVRILEPVLNIDLAPTFLDLGGVDIPSWIDGRSLVPLINRYVHPRRFNNNSDTTLVWGSTFLIESSGRRELPPHRPTANSAARRRRIKKRTKSILLEGPPEEATSFRDEEALENVCRIHPYPCQPRQKKYCKVDRRRGIRFRKCRAGMDYQLVRFGSKNVTKCSCRRRRRAATTSPVEIWDWDEERLRIDQEINQLKLKMKKLRERKRRLRVEWLMTQNRNRGGGSVSSFSRRRNFRPPHGEEFVNATIMTGADLGSLEPLETQNPQIIPPLSRKNTPPEHDDNDDDDGDDEEEEEESPRVFHHSDEEEEEEDEDEDESFGQVDVIFPPVERRRKGKGRNRGQQGKDRGRGRTTGTAPSRGSGKLLEGTGEECECEETLDPRLLRQMERDERKRRKLMSKIRKKQRFLNRIEDPTVRLQAETCGTEEKMNCFWHDRDHWRTPPLWNDGSFCFCMNSNNNTFTCLRSINATHNYLYCHFITGFKMYFNLREDPYELRNLIGSLPAAAEDWMLDQLFRLKGCQGQAECWLRSRGKDDIDSSGGGDDGDDDQDLTKLEPSIWEQIFGRLKGKRKNRNGRRKQY